MDFYEWLYRYVKLRQEEYHEFPDIVDGRTMMSDAKIIAWFKYQTALDIYDAYVRKVVKGG